MIFVIDTSGSMAGSSIEQARAALSLAIDRLSPGDRFNVIRFSDETRALFPGLRPWNAETLRHAGIDKAAIVVSATSDMLLRGTTNLQLVHQVRGLAPHARLVVTGEDAAHAEKLYAAGADHVVIPSALTGEHLQQALADASPGSLARARRLQAARLFGR